jgi:hypothetical protein
LQAFGSGGLVGGANFVEVMLKGASAIFLHKLTPLEQVSQKLQNVKFTDSPSHT